MKTTLLPILLAAFAALPLAAQERTLQGTVVDTAGAPLAGQVVVLHTVSDAGGQPVGEDTTDSRGRFSIPVPDRLGGQDVAFAAVRLDGRLYLGPMLPGGEPPAGDYVVTAGGPSPLDGLGAAAPGAAPAAAATGPSRAAPTSALALVVFLPIAGLVGFFVLRGTADPGAERRRLLAELAEVEERREAASDPALREELDARRAALRDRIAPAG